jgi:excisionase family DNA binding protein
MHKRNPLPAPEDRATVLAIAPDEAARVAGIGRTTLYRAISSGEFKSLKIGKRRLIAVETLRTWLLSHEVVS